MKRSVFLKGFKVGGGKDRFQEEMKIIGGQFDCKVSSRDTDGDLFLVVLLTG